MNEDELREIVQAERLRIANDLHDRVLQRIFATGMSLEGALRKAVVDDVITAIRQAIFDLDETVGEIRTTVYSLKGGQCSLRQQILREIERARIAWKVHVDFTIMGPVDTMVSLDKYSDVIAVTSELLNNAGRHGNGTNIKYVLEVDGSSLEISVTNECQSDRALHFGNGLENCSARASKYSGVLSVENLNPGLRILWKIPL